MQIASSAWHVASECNPPKELIELRAYFKWIQRCDQHGFEFHGSDKSDWYEAERELRDIWKNITPTDLIQFASQIDPSSLDPPAERVRELAYFKSLARSNSSEQSKQCWIEAESEERERRFAVAFLEFHSSQKTCDGHLVF